jgi:FkbM family methyltransferase
LKGLPEAGLGWAGGSVVVPADHELITRTGRVFGYEKIQQEVLPITLEELIKSVMTSESCQDIDLIKIDCEGCEHSSIGCCDTEVLRRVRYIVGEYHDII